MSIDITLTPIFLLAGVTDRVNETFKPLAADLVKDGRKAIVTEWVHMWLFYIFLQLTAPCCCTTGLEE